MALDASPLEDPPAWRPSHILTSMSFGKIMGGLLLVGAVAYTGYLLEVPTMLIAGLSAVTFVVYFGASLR